MFHLAEASSSWDCNWQQVEPLRSKHAVALHALELLCATL